MAKTQSVIEVDFDWRKSIFFQFCEAADWENFLSVVTLAEKPDGSVLWYESECSNQLFCVISGALESIKKTPEWGKPIIMARFLPGTSVGESIFTDITDREHTRHSTTLQVVDKASLLILDEAAAAMLQEKAPATVAKLVRGAASLQLQRLRQLNRRLATLF